jgi:hypothetical protein
MEVLNANDNLFQLAFWKGVIWDKVEEILKMWKECVVKGQKSKKKPKGKGKAKESVETEAKSPTEDMKLTDWRLMQALKDEEVVTPVLQRIILGELTLQEMGQEFKRLKTMATI